METPKKTEVDSKLLADQAQTRINSVGYVPPTPVSWNTANSIGPFQLQTKLGEGGMGEVWLAEQSEPVKRSVALKLIKQGMGSQQTIARFEAERQALALMNHPNIAKILDAGTTPEGQPYFAMELVKGQSLTNYCDENRLGINQRLELFMEVCQGVQHAHQKGIIHRDLKPSNILVTLIDNKAVPKVIDFGLAKATGSQFRLTDSSMYTNVGQILGTFKYMSPEQASLDSNDIDTRTDIYALGVILYELLTGSTPLDDPSLRGQAALKLLEFIRDHEPVKPSSQLVHKTREQISSITDRRKTDSVQLNRVLAGDLDWVVMKALDRNRARRYDSASSFSEDIARYLKSEPVLARPPTLSYRVQKFVRKHRNPVLAGGLLVGSLILGIMGTMLALRQARQAQVQADARSVELVELTKFQTRQFGDVNLAVMGNRIRQQIIDQNAIQPKQDLTEQIQSVNFTDIAADVFAESIIKPALAAIASDLKSSPQVKASMLQSVAEIAHEVGLNELGIPPQLEALKIRQELYGTSHRDTIKSLIHAGLMHQFKGGEKNDYLSQAMEASQQAFGVNDELSLDAVVQFAEDLRQRGNVEAAQRYFEQVIERSSPQSPERVDAQRGLGTIYMHLDQPETALTHLSAALELAESLYSKDSAKVLSIKAFIAWVLQSNQRAAESEILFREVHSANAKTLGNQHPDTIDSLKGLGESLAEQTKFEAASEVFDQALSQALVSLGRSHQLTLACMSNKARILVELGRTDEAKPVFEEALQSCRIAFGEDHPATLESLSDLGIFYMELGEFAQAEEFLRQSWEGSARVFGPQDGRTKHRLTLLESIKAGTNVKPK